MPVVPIRSWQFHALDLPYVSKALARAPEYDVNTVVYSHGIISAVSQLYEDPDRAASLRVLADEAHERGLNVVVWVHELERDVPGRYLQDNVVQLDRPGFWDWLAAKYERLFSDFPQFDGLMLTFHETKYKIFSEHQVQSALSMPERFAKLINTIDGACARHSKNFIVRSFLYEPRELQWFAEGMANVHPRVMLQSKCEPHDWQPFYPHNPMIGRFPHRKLIVEFDCSSEFTGKNRIPYTSPEYMEHRWRYGISQPGVVGYNARLDHGGYDALFTPNEINLYALYRMSADPAVTSDQVWREWTRLRYGEEAAHHVEKALRPAFDVVNKCFFALEFWITNHSKLPTFGYADGHLASRTIAKWKPDEPRYQELEKALRQPDPVLLEEILREKDEAAALTDEMLYHLSQAKPHLSAAHYDDLAWRLGLLRRTVEVWKAHAEAFFGYKVLAGGHQVPGLYERVQRAISALYLQAEVSAKAGLGEEPPAAAGEIRAVADELRGLLEAWRAATTK